jgi:hypothetical protein
MLTVVSGGWLKSLSGRSSKPTTETSSGTRRPASRSARISPNAISSLAQNTAVTAESAASSRPIS